MATWKGILVLLVLMTALPVQAEEAVVTESRAIVGAFMAELKGELESAIRTQGPVEAVAVCQRQAPAIAARLSLESGGQVARTSLRLRNPDNAPDAWERQVLERFKQLRQQGSDPMSLEYSEVVSIDGEMVLRYMKAIPTGAICLLCHGQDIDPAVQEALKRLYPQDQATGFSPGDIRGAFTVTKPLDGKGE
ncbi:DUF3365 domain-containing protein [Desulfuromonas sp. AOP6]|uniref:Tll0287-like domain-containing protein n=1 Tax=Desulfuromonas sp. AOP6 TaxID=1566351 RepID=UPI0012763151|nr:DUF3365 domain-containing protein [Desulfuromonas sp. AOP6]BCA80487.1 hypothetical protein AOP6_2274 [Desulfuromonas sp. AOP6]